MLKAVYTKERGREGCYRCSKLYTLKKDERKAVTDVQSCIHERKRKGRLFQMFKAVYTKERGREGCSRCSKLYTLKKEKGKAIPDAQSSIHRRRR